MPVVQKQSVCIKEISASIALIKMNDFRQFYYEEIILWRNHTLIDTKIKSIVLTNSRFVFIRNCSHGCEGRRSGGEWLGGRRCHDRRDRGERQQVHRVTGETQRQWSTVFFFLWIVSWPAIKTSRRDKGQRRWHRETDETGRQWSTFFFLVNCFLIGDKDSQTTDSADDTWR